MRSTSSRWGALLAAGVLAVHEARYRLLDAQAGADASSAGHGYLGALTAVVGVALVLALGRYLHLWVARRSDENIARIGPLALWAVASCAVLAGYVGQELVAGSLASGHPVGLSGLVAQGGWVAIPLSFAAGGLIGCVLRTAAQVLCRRVNAAASPATRAVELRRFPTVDVVIPCGRGLARHLAGRAPPLQLSR